MSAWSSGVLAFSFLVSSLLVVARPASVDANDPDIFDLLAPTENWALASGDPDVDGFFVSRGRSAIGGRACVGGGRLGPHAIVDGDLVSTIQTGAVALRISPRAKPRANVRSAGGRFTVGRAHGGLPGIPDDEVPTGKAVAKEDGSGIYDSTGLGIDLDGCRNLLASVSEAANMAAKLPVDFDAGDGLVPIRSQRTIPPLAPGQVAVVRFSRVELGPGAELTFDGGGAPDSFVIVVVEGRLRLSSNSRITFENELDPSNVVFLVGGSRCAIGRGALGGGSLVCADGTIRFRGRVHWQGRVFGGSNRIAIGKASTITPKGEE